MDRGSSCGLREVALAERWGAGGREGETHVTRIELFFTCHSEQYTIADTTGTASPEYQDQVCHRISVLGGTVSVLLFLGLLYSRIWIRPLSVTIPSHSTYSSRVAIFVSGDRRGSLLFQLCLQSDKAKER